MKAGLTRASAALPSIITLNKRRTDAQRGARIKVPNHLKAPSGSSPKSICFTHRVTVTDCDTHSHALSAGKRGALTGVEQTLEVEDDQNKGSQTSGENHPADPAHPHQLTQSLLHGGTDRHESPRLLWILMRTENRQRSQTHPSWSVPLPAAAGEGGGGGGLLERRQGGVQHEATSASTCSVLLASVPLCVCRYLEGNSRLSGH